MKKSLNLIFWGYIFILIRIDLGADLLPDPLGYGMIAIGCDNLYRSFPTASKPRIIAAALVFISFPTLFINVNKVTTPGWLSYAMFLATVKLILIYYLFHVFKSIAKKNDSLLRQVNNRGTVFIVVNFIVLLHMSFSLNLASDQFQILTIVIIISALIMDIVFLILIRTLKHAMPRGTYD